MELVCFDKLNILERCDQSAFDCAENAHCVEDSVAGGNFPVYDSFLRCLKRSTPHPYEVTIDKLLFQDIRVIANKVSLGTDISVQDQEEMMEER